MHTPFSLQHLDHVAIRIRNIEDSVDWYRRVLGLEAWQPEEWKPFPVFMMKGNFGIALFPVQAPASELTPHTRHYLTIDHFAFRVSMADLQAAQAHFEELGIPCQFQDHTYFHSIYIKDPDGHTVELTAEV